MGEAQELQLQIMVQEHKEAKATEHTKDVNQSLLPRPRNCMWWLQMALYTLFILFGQSVATLLGRLYFNNGGKSKWMATLVQLVGFPILIPYYCISSHKHPTTSRIGSKPPSALKLTSVYVSLGLLVAVHCYFYSVGLQYLPVSTYSLLCASALAFNAFFSYFLNAQKFTAFIINSLVLLTISSILLAFQSDSAGSNGESKAKYAIGFICTILASAGTGLGLSLTQLCFQKVLKRETFSVVMELIIYQSTVPVCAVLVGLFASGEWNGLNREMDEFKTGKVSYLMILIWTAISWQVFMVGIVGLIFELSSLFSNAISVFGLPIVPVLAIIFFHEKMDGIKGISMVLAIWGFVSYVYQQYLDHQETVKNKNEVSEASASDRSI
ncbi:TPT domain-containing protein [Cephalotus follicularis]|uniref:Probable purine permease n=1 Tax=Cephalotus follicularis TaxID=3775 RepID=A0A1Q3D2I7_CEPFO|nr:TPT domain-containing protein [Cephalotus follicularis]